MNRELLHLYVVGLFKDWFGPESNALRVMPDSHYEQMNRLENSLNKNKGVDRKFNSEFQEALKVFDSPLMKALE